MKSTFVDFGVNYINSYRMDYQETWYKIHVPFRMNWFNFDDPLTFLLALPYQ